MRVAIQERRQELLYPAFQVPIWLVMMINFYPAQAFSGDFERMS